MNYFVDDFLSYKLHFIKTDKFKTVNIKIVFSQKAIKNEITIKNFLSDILTYSSKKYNTEKKMAMALQDLYAMSLFSSCYRIGKLYNMEIGASILNEKYAEKGILKSALKLLSEVIFNPNVIDNKFDEISFDFVKINNKNQIDSIWENTRKLSLIRMLEHMDNSKEFSYHGFGYIEDLEKITPGNLYEYYKKIISNSKIDIFVLGDIDVDEIKKYIKEFFKFKTIKNKKNDLIITHEKIRRIPKKVIEQAHISQSKLSIGCKIENLNDFERNYVLPMYSMILGGGSGSKLFKEVREKNSLCYYISSSAAKLDNILFITSGIDFNNFDKTIKLIKKEIKNIILGNFSNNDLQIAKNQYIAMLDEIEDSPFQIISSYYSVEMLGYDSIEIRKEKTNSVTFNDVKEFASKVHIDTIYLLKGIENE